MWSLYNQICCAKTDTAYKEEKLVIAIWIEMIAIVFWEFSWTFKSYCFNVIKVHKILYVRRKTNNLLIGGLSYIENKKEM
jgi:hypothetical protein